MEGSSDAKYSVTLLIPKTDTVLVAQVNAAIEAAMSEGLAAKFGGKRPPMWKNPLRDGDTERDDDAFAGHWFVNASGRQQPGIVNRQMQRILNPADFKSGDFARVDVKFYAFNTSGNKGVACGLNNIQKWEEGESLTGARSAEAAFGAPDPLLG
jgi:hypothetical protein